MLSPFPTPLRSSSPIQIHPLLPSCLLENTHQKKKSKTKQTEKNYQKKQVTHM